MASLQELLDAYTREPWNPARREAIDNFVRMQDEYNRLNRDDVGLSHAGKRAKITYETPTFRTTESPHKTLEVPGFPAKPAAGKTGMSIFSREPIFRSNVTKTTRLPGAGFQPEGQDLSLIHICRCRRAI